MATRKATATPAKATATRAPARKAAAPKAAPAPKAAAQPTIEFGSAWLVEHVNEQAGTSYSASSLRILLRKLTKEGVLARDSEGRSRYNFPKGANDPQVKAIVKAVKSGAAETARQERLDELKATRKAAPKKAAAAPARKSRKAAPVVDEDDALEDLDDDVDEI